MSNYSLSHLADHVLLRDLAVLVSQDRVTTARLLAHLAEVDERRLYLPAAHPSMFAYCVHELRMSEETAFRRIRVARAARKFPAIYGALADGRLNLTAVLLLVPHLSPETADDLLAAAMNRTKPEIERLLAERFPQPDLPTLVQPSGPAQGMADVSERQVVPSPDANRPSPMEPLAPEPVGLSRAPVMPTHPQPLASSVEPRAKVAPLSPGRFALQLTVGQETHDKLRYAQALLGHAVPSGDIAQVLDRALDALIEKLEKQKFAKGARSGRRRGTANGRYLPAHIRRAVWQRDGGRCTYVSDQGQRCESRTRLEFDHIQPVARGGHTTAANTRLRCRAHNQYAAECVYGAGFMREKRENARHETASARVRRTAAGRRAQTGAPAQARPLPTARPTAAGSHENDVVPWLRQLGYGVEMARRGAALCAHIPDAPLEARVKLALRRLAPAHVRRTAASG